MVEKRSFASDEERVFAHALGHELRKHREMQGLTRDDLIRKLPSGIGDRTLLSYEHGWRGVSAWRFVELFEKLGVDPAEALRAILEKARDLRTLSMTVDLHALLRADDPEFEMVRTWARNRLDDETKSRVTLSPMIVRELAKAFSLPHATLASHLAKFIDRDVEREKHRS